MKIIDYDRSNRRRGSQADSPIPNLLGAFSGARLKDKKTTDVSKRNTETSEIEFQS
jgi:hypothetical protein